METFEERQARVEQSRDATEQWLSARPRLTWTILAVLGALMVVALATGFVLIGDLLPRLLLAGAVLAALVGWRRYASRSA